MRIALVLPLIAPVGDPMGGGALTFLQDLAAGLVARGHAVDVYAASGSAVAGANVIDLDIRSEELAESRYRHDQPSQPNLAAEMAFSRVFSAIRGRDYDVVHNHAFDVPAVRHAARLEFPVVHTMHLPPDEGMVAALIAAQSAAHAPVVAAVSESQAQAWRSLVAIDVILHPKIPTAAIPWSPRPGTRAIFAGRLTLEKGAAEAMDAAAEAGLGIDVYGDAYDPDYVDRELTPRRSRPGVTWHGGVPRPKLFEAMTQAAVMICPARWQEPLGMVAAESIAAGTPVVAYAVGGLPEVIVDGVTGFLVEPGDHGRLVDAVRRAPRLSRAACRQYAVEELDIARALEEHERLYEALAGGTHRPAAAFRGG